jgi:hypothetical protein
VENNRKSKRGFFYLSVILASLILLTELLQANPIFTNNDVADQASSWTCGIASQTNNNTVSGLLPNVQHNVGVQCIVNTK